MPRPRTTLLPRVALAALLLAVTATTLLFSHRAARWYSADGYGPAGLSAPPYGSLHLSEPLSSSTETDPENTLRRRGRDGSGADDDPDPYRGAAGGAPEAPPSFLQGAVALPQRTVAYRAPRRTVALLNRDTAAARAESRVIAAVLSHRREHRDAIRRTWAFGRSRQVWFVVGGNWTAALAAELRRHQDVLWVDVEEFYRGITVKVQATLAAIDQLLRHYEFVLKTDQDCYVRMDNLEALLAPGGRHAATPYWGPCFTDSKIYRWPPHKWYVPKALLPGRKVYPPYASGAGYVLQRSLLRCVLREMPAVPTLPVEDAYVGAVVERCRANCTDDGRRVLQRFEQSWADADLKRSPWVVLHDLKKASRLRFVHEKTCCKFGYQASVSCRNLNCTTLQRSEKK